MTQITKRKICAIILAAGKGKRMRNKEANKVTLLLNNKPMVFYIIELLDQLQINPVIVVVGHAKGTVEKALRETKVIFAEQKEQLGTGHAVQQAIEFIPEDATDVIILYGDDSYLYKKDLLSKMINMHVNGDQALTFLTIDVQNPKGLGRIIRDSSDRVCDIIEEKDATDREKNVKEVNPNFYLLKTGFLKKYLPLIAPSPATGEYYLPSLIKLAYKAGIIAKVVKGGQIPWQGINTQEDLDIAEKLIKSK